MSRNKEIAFENRDKYVKLGLSIAFYRKFSGMSQEQLAEKAGISRSYLSEIEAPGTVVNVSLEVLFRIASALGVTCSQIIERIE